MSLTLVVLLWAEPGQEAALVDYEDRVLALIPDHGGQILQRVRTAGTDDEPLEVQVLQFPSGAALERFMTDDRRAALAGLRDRVVARSQVLRANLV